MTDNKGISKKVKDEVIVQTSLDLLKKGKISYKEYLQDIIEYGGLTSEMKEILLFLHDDSRTQEELVRQFPKMHLETLGKLGSMYLIDHQFPLVWITSVGEKLLRILEDSKIK